MNNLKSYTEYAVTSETTDFVIGFDFNYGTDAVNVTVDGVPATEAGYTVVYLNSTTMRLTPAVPTGVVRLQRETDIDVPDNRFTAGAKFIASNMDENFTQVRHAQQEVRDGFNKLSTDTYEIIDTLQDVGQAAQDAADAAEAAAQTANDAAAQVNDKVSYQDLDNAVEVAVTPVKEAIIDPITGKATASKVFDASGENQQLLNTGLATVSQLSQIASPYDGMRISVKSVVEPNYALARPYAGAGEFIYTSAKSGVNDGGVVINGWVRIFDGGVKPEWWGADPTGAVASGSAIQSAINYCRNNPVRPMGASRGGMGSIELDGFYKVDIGLDLTQVNGISFRAKSKYSTVLLFSPAAATMFNLQRYLNVTFEDILFSCGVYNISTDQLITLPAIKTAVAFNLSGQDGGKQLAFNRCRFEGFKTAFRTMDDGINCDTFTATKCDFASTDTIWENSNVNAVIWAFENCTFFLYKKAFINPANGLRITGGQAIGDTWWFGDSGSPALNSYLTFKGIRFESGLNLDASAQPKYLDIACSTAGVVFEDCPMYGLPSGGIDSVVTGKINFNNPKGDIKFKNMMVYGTFEVISGYAKNGVTNRLTFEDCEKTPTVNQTYNTGSANKYINLVYKDHWIGDTVRVNRTFLSMFNSGGSGGGVALGQSTVPMIDVFSFFRVATAAGSYPRELPIWCVDPYKLNVSKFEFSYQKGVAAASFDIAVYRDSTKAVKIAEILNVGAGRNNGVVEIPITEFILDQEITSTSAPLFVDVTNTASLGLINLDTHVHLIQQAHQF